MKLIIGTQEEVIKKAAQRYVKLLNEKPEAVLGLATGSTPLGLYAELAKLCAEGKLSFAKCTTFNLDEYIGLDGTHDQSYRYFMNKNLFEKVDVRMEATHVPSGAVKSDEEAEQYDSQIKAAGGIDLQLLGMGHNGHIAFNEPGDNFGLGTHVVSLSERTIDANQRFFESRDEVPRHALSMGIKSIMGARRILVVVSGEDKADAVCKAVTGPVTDQVPASVLQLHPDVTLVGDTAALSKLKEAGVPVCG